MCASVAQRWELRAASGCFEVLEVFWLEACVFGNLRQDFRAKLFLVMESKHIRSELRVLQLDVGALLGTDFPANPLKSAESYPCLDAWPITQGVADTMEIDSGISRVSRSTSSAMAYRANA